MRISSLSCYTYMVLKTPLVITVLFVITSGVCVSNFTDIEFALHFITALSFCKADCKII